MKRLIFSFVFLFTVCHARAEEGSQAENAVSLLEETTSFLKEVPDLLQLNSEVKSIVDSMPSVKTGVAVLLKARSAETETLDELINWEVDINGKITALEKAGRKVAASLSETTSVREGLRDRTEKLKTSISFLTGSKDGRISTIFEQLRSAERDAQSQLDKLLIAQADITKLTTQLIAVHEKAEASINQMRSQFFIRDADPFFSYKKDNACLKGCVNFYNDRENSVEYLRDYSGGLILILVLTALLGLLLSWNIAILLGIAAIFMLLPLPPLTFRAALVLIGLFPFLTLFKNLAGYQTVNLALSGCLFTLSALLLPFISSNPTKQFLIKSILLFIATIVLYLVSLKTRANPESSHPKLNRILNVVSLWGSIISALGTILIVVGYWNLGGTIFDAVVSTITASLLSIFLFLSFLKVTDSLVLRGIFGALCIAAVAWRSLVDLGFSKPVSSLFFKILEYGVSFGTISINLKGILLAALILWLGLKISQTIRDALSRYAFSKTNLDIGAQYAIKTTVHYLLLILTIVLSLSALGINAQSLALVAGALSVGAGFGLQHIVNNVVSGLILLFERPIKPGDLISLSGVTGRVSRMGLRSTTIRTADDAEVILPNSKLIGEQLTNFTHTSTIGRAAMSIQVSADTDIGKCLDLLVEAVNETPGILVAPQPEVIFKGAKDHGLEFQVSGAIADVGRKLSIEAALIRKVFEKLQIAKISPAFPRRDVRIIEKI